jgi:hypothetical protein
VADRVPLKFGYSGADPISIDELTATDNAKIPGTIEVTGHTKFEGVTSTGATGTGKIVYDTSPTLVTPTLGTPASGDLQNCTASTETAKGVSELATVTEAIAGTDTARTTTPAGVAGAMAVQTNPLAKSQGVHLTESGTVTGMLVAPNANINFGTGDASYFWRGSIPDWQGDGNYYMFFARPSETGYIYFGLDPIATTSGKLRVNRGGNAATSTVAPDLIGGQVAEVGVVFSGDTATFYANGKQVGDAVACVAATLTSAGSLFISAYGETARKSSDTHSAVLYNRALTASEVLDLYRNGIAFADKWGSQTLLNVSNCANFGPQPYDTFDGVSATGFHAVTDGSGTARGGTADEIVFELGKKYTISFDYVLASGTNATIYIADTHSGTAVSSMAATALTGSGHYSYTITVTAPATGVVSWYLGVVASEFTISNLSVIKVGATLALEPEGIQQGRWLDSSSNALNATWPTSGASLIRPISNQPVLTNLLSNSGFGVWSNGTLENVRALPDATSTVSGTTVSSDAHALTAGMLVKDAAGTPLVFEVVSVTDANTFEVDRAGGTNGQWYEVTPACVAVDYLAMDGWGRTGSVAVPSVWRQHKDSTYTKVGSFYSAKITNPVQDDASLYYPITGIGDNVEWREKFAGRTVTFGAWVWSASAAKLCISETDQYIDNNAIATATYSAGSAWEWKEVTATFSATPAKAHFFLWLPTGATAYFSQPMLVFGSSIGEGNYQPIPQEWIEFEGNSSCTFQVTGTQDGSTAFNLEALSNGKVPKGAKVVKMNVSVTNTAANKGITLSPSNNYNQFSINSQVANIPIHTPLTLPLKDESFTIKTWSDANFTLDFAINAVQVN